MLILKKINKTNENKNIKRFIVMVFKKLIITVKNSKMITEKLSDLEIISLFIC